MLSMGKDPVKVEELLSITLNGRCFISTSDNNAYFKEHDDPKSGRPEIVMFLLRVSGQSEAAKSML